MIDVGRRTSSFLPFEADLADLTPEMPFASPGNARGPSGCQVCLLYRETSLPSRTELPTEWDGRGHLVGNRHLVGLGAGAAGAGVAMISYTSSVIVSSDGAELKGTNSPIRPSVAVASTL